MVVAPWLCKWENAQTVVEAVMDAVEVLTKPEVGVTVEAMSALLALTVNNKDTSELTNTQNSDRGGCNDRGFGRGAYGGTHE